MLLRSLGVSWPASATQDQTAYFRAVSRHPANIVNSIQDCKSYYYITWITFVMDSLHIATHAVTPT